MQIRWRGGIAERDHRRRTARIVLGTLEVELRRFPAGRVGSTFGRSTLGESAYCTAVANTSVPDADTDHCRPDPVALTGDCTEIP
jgi:hypothetical protein